MNAIQIGSLNTGNGPLVVGTLTSRRSLPAARGGVDYPCDVVEVRLDLIGADTPGWLGECRTIEAAGVPVLVTLRLASEGGLWQNPDADRIPLLASALQVVSCIDVEYHSPSREPLCALARQLGKPVIVSYHHFTMTPPIGELDDLVHRMGEAPGVIPKISTMIQGRQDIATLKELLSRHQGHPVCVIGMGPDASETRVEFPALGSCLTYGYLDSPGAPGQLPAAILRERLKRAGWPHP